MEQNFNPATLTPLISTPHLSLRDVASAELLAHRRRHSIFVPHRCEQDIGDAICTHADFPQARAKSLPAITRKKKEEFDKQAAYRILEQTVNMELSFKSYDAKECSASSHKIAQLVKEKICSAFVLLGCKVVCLCYITKRVKRSLAIDSGCAWDEFKSTVDKDAFVDYLYKNREIVAVATVFVIRCQGIGSGKKTKIDASDVPSSTSLPKARSASFTEPARKRKDSRVFVNMPQQQRGDIMR